MQIEDNTIWLHQSDMGTLRMCPEQVRLQATGEYFEADSDSAYIGTLTHRFIELVVGMGKANGEWPSEVALNETLQLLQADLTGKWDSLWQHPHQIKSLDEALAYVEQACVNWWVNVRPEIDLGDHILLEHPFDLHLGWVPNLTGKDSEVRLRGTIDFVNLTTATIKDWKTSKAATGYNMWKLERYDIQSTVYSWAAHELFDSNFTFEYHHMARGSDAHVMNSLTPTSSDFSRMKGEVMSWAATILRLGLDSPWPIGPMDWWCSSRWCSHHARGLCMGKESQIFPEDAHHLTDLMSVTNVPTPSTNTEEISL